MSNWGSIWLSVLGALIPYSLGSIKVKKKKKRSEGRGMKMEEKKNKQTSDHKPIQPASTSSDFSLASTSVFLLAVKAEPSLYPI